MARTVRTRTFTEYVSGGEHQTFFGQTVTSHEEPVRKVRITSITDYHGRPVSDSPLTILVRDMLGASYIDGSSGTPSSYHSSFLRFKPGIFAADGGVCSHCTIVGLPTAGNSMLDLLVRTNPSRPGTVVPLTLLQDLLDIPKQLMDVGHSLLSPGSKVFSPKGASAQYLGWEFGWKPLLKDVEDLLGVGEEIAKRNRELQRLYTGRGLRRRVRLGTWTASEASNMAVVSDPGVIGKVDISKLTKVERWGVVRWKPTIVPKFHPSDADTLAKARHLVRGFTNLGTMKGAWDVLPWTWLLNWFTNVGKFAMQFSNEVPASPTSQCVMTRTSTSIQLKQGSIWPNGLVYPGGIGSCVSKERYVGAGTVSIHLPYLDKWRLSILSALTIQRLKR